MRTVIVQGILIIAASSLLSASSGCASIVSKSIYPVSITSEPSGADITVFNNKEKAIFEGKTPATLELKAGRGFFQAGDYTVKFSKSGYKEITVPIRQGLDGWYLFGNIFVGGLIGWVIVDPITGAMWTIEDRHINLQPLESSALPDESTLHLEIPQQVPMNKHSKSVETDGQVHLPIALGYP